MFLCCQAKLGEEMLDYKDLAALPKTKAIYNIDRPDMLSYSPYVSYPSEERHYGEVVSLTPLCITSSCLSNLVVGVNISFHSGTLHVYIMSTTDFKIQPKTIYNSNRE